MPDFFSLPSAFGENFNGQIQILGPFVTGFGDISGPVKRVLQLTKC